MGTFIKHIPCEACGSSDANSLFDDDSQYCFACETYVGSEGSHARSVTKADSKFAKGSYRDIPNRGLLEKTCRIYGYQVGDGCHIANYRGSDGQIVAQKIRRPNKEFSIVGDAKVMGLYGQHLFSPGKSVVITEGEIDSLSVAQAFDCKWPVVSLPTGAPSAVKAIKGAYEWLVQFEKIVLCFDMDEPGQKAAQEVAELLPPGKAWIMRLDLKDANEVIVKHGTAPIVKSYWNAQVWRPDGIISGSDITRELLQKAAVRGYSLPYTKLDKMLSGAREGELMLLTAGSGIGKSTMAREIGYHLHQKHGLIIGNIYLEEGVEKTAQGYVAIHNNISLGRLRANPGLLDDDCWDRSIQTVVSGQYFYDHFGSMESGRLLAKMRYMRQVLKVNFIILDHLSIVISGQTSSSEGERRDIDMLMTNLRMLIEETGVGVIAIVHLNSPEGKAHEEGGRVTLKHLRGSGSLKQLSDVVIALERDQQGDECNESTIRVLKSREHGIVGQADTLEYNETTGRLLTVVNPLE